MLGFSEKRSETALWIMELDIYIWYLYTHSVMYKRKILPALEKELHTKEIVMLTGMRQVGKTTLLRHLFEKAPGTNKVFLDLEDPLIQTVFDEKSFERIWQNLARYGVKKNQPAVIFLDEVQNLPIVSRAVKYLYDHYHTKFFLTGSSSFYLKHLFPESLAGRKIVYELFPLTFEEFLWFKGERRDTSDTFREKSLNKNRVSYEQLVGWYREYMEFGGFPAVVLEPDYERKRVLLREIFKSYYEIDVKSLGDFREVGVIRDLVLLLVPRIGSKIDLVKLASELGVSRHTVRSYLTFLEQTYLVSLVTRFTKSVDRRAAGRKKLYFSDSGLANILGKLSEGQLLENSVFASLKVRGDLAYLDRGRKTEIDFIVDGTIGVEVKRNASKQDFRHLAQLSVRVGLAENYVVSFVYSDLDRVITCTDV